MLSLRSCWKMNGAITSPLLVTIPNLIMWTKCLVFMNRGTSRRDRTSQRLFYEFTTWSWQKFFSSEKNQNIRLVCMLEFVEKLRSTVYPLVLPLIEITLSLLFWEIANVFMHYLPDKKLIHSNVHGYGPDCLAEVFVNHDLDPINKLGNSFFRNDQSGASKLSYLCN